MPTHQHLVDKMRRHSCFVFLFCGIFLPGILGFPQTNTSIDCDSLLPNYEAEPQTSAPPYIIAVSFDNFEPGNEVQVTLEALGDAGFKGFNLQAREIDGDVPVGTFKITDPNTKGLECHNMTNSAVSHANSDVKQKVTTTWIAPQDAREIQFIATVVQNLENFWVGIQSKTLTPIHSVSVNATGKSKRKLMIELECNKRGGTYSTGRCIMVGPSSSSQNSYSGSQGGVVYTISKSGCVPGGAAGAYGLQACRDSASLSGGGLTYGQSVPSSSSDSSKKVVVVANSNPFPPVRHTFPQSLGSSATRIIVQSGQKQQTSSSTYVQGSQGSQSYSQGYRPQSGSSYSQGGPGFSGSSSSYGQGSQGSQSYGQGYQPQGGSSYGQQGGSASYGGSSGCGQGVSYDSNPCHQGGSQGGQGGSYSSQNYGGSQQSGSSYSQSYSDNQDGSYSQNYGGGQGGSSSDTYYENQDSQDFSDDSNPNACDDNDTTYSAKNQRSGCAKKKVLVARDTSHVLSRRAYDVQNASSPSNSSQSDIQGGSFIATSGSSNQGGCICPDGSSGHRQGAPGSSYSTYSGNQGGPFFYPGGSYGQGGPSFYPGGSYGQGAPGSSYSTYSGNQGGPFFYPGGSYGQGGPGSSHSSYYGNQGGPSFYPGGSYGQGGSSAYDGSSESYGQGGSSTYSGSDAYGQDSLSIGGSETEDSDSALPTGDGQSERDFYSPGGSQSGGHGSSSQSGSYASGQDSSSSGSSQYGGQGSPSSGGSQSGGQGGCDCSGGSSGGSPSLVRSDSSANDSSSSGGSQYNSQESSSYGGSQYGGQGSPSSGGSQYGGQGSPSSGGSQYGGQGFSSGVRQSGGQGSYSGSNQYGGQGSYPSGSSQYGGQGGRPSGGRPHGKPGSSSSGGSHQGKPGGSGSGSTYSGKPQSPYSGGSQVSSAGKHSTPQLLMLFSVLSAFALSAAVSKWSI
ncbi:hornerin-like isoform X42 [Corvus kubaryi]|uniref:hornerin-like isoform X42 n=1 Tax=Corvus kubaryi TaxID=68294 RepID=UPI001C05CEC8|nr:hornerin-like isoform X42 [Corvus kubaryi]